MRDLLVHIDISTNTTNIKQLSISFVSSRITVVRPQDSSELLPYSTKAVFPVVSSKSTRSLYLLWLLLLACSAYQMSKSSFVVILAAVKINRAGQSEIQSSLHRQRSSHNTPIKGLLAVRVDCVHTADSLTSALDVSAIFLFSAREAKLVLFGVKLNIF